MLDGVTPEKAIEELIDELESYAEKSPWWAGNKIHIPDEDFFRLTQTIREKLPAELHEAQSMLEKRDLILKNAQDEHRRIMSSAERRLEDMTNEEQVVVAAHQHAEHIVNSARHDAAAIKRDALLYTADLLKEMEQQFVETITTVRKGREFLETKIEQEVEENLSKVDDFEENIVRTDDNS